jgi:calcineurin-like phosphoesterase family protein
MDDFMLTAWNETVDDQDIVYHLGDVYMGSKGREILPKLKGRKRLILGNHDVGKDKILLSNFQKIGVWRMWPEYGVLLTHVPVHESTFTMPRKDQSNGLINCHGHTHRELVDANNTAEDRYYNACVEWHDYKPFPIEQIKEDTE